VDIVQKTGENIIIIKINPYASTSDETSRGKQRRDNSLSRNTEIHTYNKIRTYKGYKSRKNIQYQRDERAEQIIRTLAVCTYVKYRLHRDKNLFLRGTTVCNTDGGTSSEFQQSRNPAAKFQWLGVFRRFDGQC
jgi:hypothetical protein